jgi:hypothetical protein
VNHSFPSQKTRRRINPVCSSFLPQDQEDAIYRSIRYHDHRSSKDQSV